MRGRGSSIESDIKSGNSGCEVPKNGYPGAKRAYFGISMHIFYIINIYK